MKKYNPLQNGVLNLSKNNLAISNCIKKYGLPKDKPLKGGFKTLLRMIIGQQISVKAADSIWSKLENSININEKNILNCSENNLKNVGLQKELINSKKNIFFYNFSIFL